MGYRERRVLPSAFDRVLRFLRLSVCVSSLDGRPPPSPHQTDTRANVSREPQAPATSADGLRCSVARLTKAAVNTHVRMGAVSIAPTPNKALPTLLAAAPMM